LGKPSTLFWQSFGGTSVEVSGFPSGSGKKTFPVQGDPPYPGNTAVTVPSDQAQRDYTIEVFSGSGEHRQVGVTLTQNPALITRYVTQPTPAPNPFNPTASIGLLWSTLYASKVYLLSPTGMPVQQQPNPLSPITIWPGRDAIASAPDLQQIPDVVTYTLEAQGFQKPDTDEIVFELASVKVLYFKYLTNEDGTLSDVSFQTDGDWPALQMVSDPNLNVLTVYQPGSKSAVLYLGSGDTTHPQIQYFASKPAEGGGFTLSWVTANLTALTLQPDGYQVPPEYIAKGSYNVNPSVTMSYVLQGVLGSQSISSTLVVKVGPKDSESDCESSG
jgi:hypothetical protein